MGIGRRLKEARINAGLTQALLAETIGVTKGAIGNYENETSHPRDGILYEIMKALNVDANYLFQDEMRNVTTDFRCSFLEQEYIKKYRTLDEHGKKVVDVVLEQECERIKKKEKIELFTIEPAFIEAEEILEDINVYYQPASAGLGNFIDDVSYEVMNFPVGVIPREAKFGIRISGDSMEPTVKNRQIVFIKPDARLKNGDIGIFIYEGETYCKRLELDYDNRKSYLVSDNKKYSKIELKEECRTIGKVLL